MSLKLNSQGSISINSIVSKYSCGFKNKAIKSLQAFVESVGLVASRVGRVCRVAISQCCHTRSRVEPVSTFDIVLEYDSSLISVTKYANFGEHFLSLVVTLWVSEWALLGNLG